MNIKIIIYISCFPLLLLLSGNAFSASGDFIEFKTVRQMQENIDALQQEKTLLDFKWNNFKIGSSSLGELIKDDLSIVEQDVLFGIVETYNTKNNTGESILKTIIDTNGDESSQRRALLLLKKDFYTSIKPYIAEDRLEKFLAYIGTDLSLNEKSKDVDSKIVKIQSSKEKRVQDIQEKIEDNNKILRENIENKITTQVKSKLDIFTTSGDFVKLPNNAKIEVFNRIIVKLEYESIRLTNLENTTSIIEEKIVVFRVMINLLKEYTDSWSS